ncbi:hypothetical protein LWI28_018983 [Acer negundo]|uniref:MBD domain-containing protein n=1 Tax=Acer negundo TaxID=4023 RepID=A0AAD5IG09_ACENE|nr:hypothetical protein LWI28_018983 [Acer negundo]KAK4838986.1 hypothetical protein QYF36_018149 [Acer negundo]
MAADHSLPPGWRVEFRFRKNGRKDKVLIERAEPEGLPPGWIKEIKVSKSAHKVRRDPFYIDPVSGYIFRSMRDVSRYLETGDVGRLATKPKEKHSQDDHDSESDKDHSPTASKKQKTATTGTETPVTGQSTKPGKIAKDEDVTGGRENTPLSKPTSNQGGAGAEMSSSNLPEAKDSSQVDEGKDSDKTVGLPTPDVGAVPEKQALESGDIEGETKKSKLGKSKSRKKKVLDLPRRSSKRLAGVTLNPTPELIITNTRARRPVGKQSGDEVASTIKGSKSTEDSRKSTNSKHHSEDLANPNENAESSKKQEPASALPPQNQAKVEICCEADAKPKPEPPLDLDFGDLLSDPCIAFAIKTLTGDNFETSSGIEVSMGSNNSNSEGITTPEQNTGKEKQNVAIPGERAVNVVGNSCKTDDEKPGVSLDSPFADIMTDPCIEFAIKTLTGTIPVGCELDTQQQLNSSQTQSAKNFCQTEFLSQKYNVLEKPLTIEQARTGNLSIKKSGGATGLRQPGENRFNECH